jgi:hypothetical protein
MIWLGCVGLGWRKSKPDRASIFFNCKTNLIETFRTLFPNTVQFEGNREIYFQLQDLVPLDEIAICVETALTDHRKK